MSRREAAILPAREAEREVQEMIKVAMEVQSGAARIGVTVQAESIERALRLVARRFPRIAG